MRNYNSCVSRLCYQLSNIYFHLWLNSEVKVNAHMCTNYSAITYQYKQESLYKSEINLFSLFQDSITI